MRRAPKYCQLLILFLAMTATALASVKAYPITLQDYLKQVEEQSPGVQSSELAIESSELRDAEWKSLTMPQFTAGVSYLDDQTEPLSRFGTGDQTIVKTFDVGLLQQTNFGLQARLGYSLLNREVNGLVPVPINGVIVTPPAQYWEASPRLELTQSLWKNFFGTETRANQELIRSQVQSQRYNETFRRTQLIARAEEAYWRLALSRGATRLYKESVSRGEKILGWNRRRENLRLADRADRLQAQANLLSFRQLLLQAQNSEKSAARDFNSLRFRDEDAVTEELTTNTEEYLAKLPKATIASRSDLKAVEAQLKLAQANTVLARERNKPTLEAFANLSLNGRENEMNPAVDESLTSDYPRNLVGVRMVMPLDFSIRNDVIEGYRKDEQAASLSYQQKQFETKRLLHDLNQRNEEAKQRFELLSQLADVQKQKLENERSRLSRGRTTTYQVILFEQDYANTQIERLRLENEILSLNVQLKTFGDAQ